MAHFPPPLLVRHSVQLAWPSCARVAARQGLLQVLPWQLRPLETQPARVGFALFAGASGLQRDFAGEVLAPALDWMSPQSASHSARPQPKAHSSAQAGIQLRKRRRQISGAQAATYRIRSEFEWANGVSGAFREA
jgi:hypothetical protein